MEELQKEEINTELLVCVENNEIKMVYDWCVDNDKTIIITSDMYLPATVISRILENNGFNKHTDVYVSSEFAATKRKGTLFRIIKEKYKDKRIIHIGDALRSDYIEAKINGLGAVRVTKHNWFNNCNNNAFCEKNTYYEKKMTDYYEFGYEVFGPAVLGFCEWIYSEIEKNDIDNIFFLARDGYLVKQVFNGLYPHYNNKTKYLYVSRKAIRLSSLYGEERLENLASLFPQHTLLTIKDLCKKIGVDDKEYQDNIKNNLFLPYEIVLNNEISSFCSQLLKSIQPRCKRENEILKQYLGENGFTGKIAIVDIGWAGTIQSMLTKITGVDVIGYYFGTDKKKSDNNKRSFVNPEYGIQEFVAALVEYPFLATEGSVEKYIENEQGTVMPILSEFEYSDKEKEIIVSMQQGIFDYAINNKDNDENENQKVLLKKLIRVCRYPNKKELNLLGDLTYYEDGSYYLAKPDRLSTYALNPRRFKYDLSMSGWKIGFLKRLFRLDINYYNLLKLIKGR